MVGSVPPRALTGRLSLALGWTAATSVVSYRLANMVAGKVAGMSALEKLKALEAKLDE